MSEKEEAKPFKFSVSEVKETETHVYVPETFDGDGKKQKVVYDCVMTESQFNAFCKKVGAKAVK